MASNLHQFITRLSRQILLPGGRRRIRTAVIPEQLETRILLSNAPVLLEGNPDGDSFPGEAVATTKGIFSQAFEPTTGYEIYLSDGTTAGTKMVRDLYTGATSSNPSDFTEGDGVIFFTAVTQNLWHIDCCRH
jgi:ELWxxDGT repeat protein